MGVNTLRVMEHQYFAKLPAELAIEPVSRHGNPELWKEGPGGGGEILEDLVPDGSCRFNVDWGVGRDSSQLRCCIDCFIEGAEAVHQPKLFCSFT